MDDHIDKWTKNMDNCIRAIYFFASAAVVLTAVLVYLAVVLLGG
jgi:hypothetical protein